MPRELEEKNREPGYLKPITMSQRTFEFLNAFPLFVIQHKLLELLLLDLVLELGGTRMNSKGGRSWDREFASLLKQLCS